MTCEVVPFTDEEEAALSPFHRLVRAQTEDCPDITESGSYLKGITATYTAERNLVLGGLWRVTEVEADPYRLIYAYHPKVAERPNEVFELMAKISGVEQSPKSSSHYSADARLYIEEFGKRGMVVARTSFSEYKGKLWKQRMGTFNAVRYSEGVPELSRKATKTESAMLLSLPTTEGEVLKRHLEKLVILSKSEEEAARRARDKSAKRVQASYAGPKSRYVYAPGPFDLAKI
jgi:hypothetical protein